jgi:hypothetical protein
VNDVKVNIEEADYNVSGREAVDIVLNMRNFEKIYRIEAFPSSRMRLGNGTRIDKRVWWLNIFVSPPEGIGGNIFNAFVDVNTGEVYDLYMVHWSSG